MLPITYNLIGQKKNFLKLQYMRPQFRFLIYYGRKNPRVNLVDNLDRFFYDMEKVVSGDASVWGAPVVIDGVHVLPEVECLVPSIFDSHSGSSADLINACLALSLMVGIPRGRFSSLPGLGIHTLLNGFALSVPALRFVLCNGGGL